MHAWDEAWAFYAGSLEVGSFRDTLVNHDQIFSYTMMIMIGSLYRRPNQSNLKGTAGNSEGRMLYRLAEKRCKNFGTCRTNIAEVNKQILSLFISGKKSLEEGR